MLEALRHPQPCGTMPRRPKNNPIPRSHRGIVKRKNVMGRGSYLTIQLDLNRKQYDLTAKLFLLQMHMNTLVRLGWIILSGNCLVKNIRECESTYRNFPLISWQKRDMF